MSAQSRIGMHYKNLPADMKHGKVTTWSQDQIDELNAQYLADAEEAVISAMADCCLETAIKETQVL